MICEVKIETLFELKIIVDRNCILLLALVDYIASTCACDIKLQSPNRGRKHEVTLTCFGKIMIVSKVLRQFQRFLCQSVARTTWNTVVWVMCFIKTFQIIWNVWNTSVN